MQCKGPYAFSIGYKTRVAPDRTRPRPLASRGVVVPRVGGSARLHIKRNTTVPTGAGRIVRVDSTVFGWFAWRAYGERKTEMRRAQPTSDWRGSEMASGEDSMALATIQHAVNHAVAHRNEDGAVGADAEGTRGCTVITIHFATPACPFL